MKIKITFKPSVTDKIIKDKKAEPIVFSHINNIQFRKKSIIINFNGNQEPAEIKLKYIEKIEEFRKEGELEI